MYHPFRLKMEKIQSVLNCPYWGENLTKKFIGITLPIMRVNLNLANNWKNEEEKNSQEAPY